MLSHTSHLNENFGRTACDQAGEGPLVKQSRRLDNTVRQTTKEIKPLFIVECCALPWALHGVPYPELLWLDHVRSCFPIVWSQLCSGHFSTARYYNHHSVISSLQSRFSKNEKVQVWRLKLARVAFRTEANYSIAVIAFFKIFLQTNYWKMWSCWRLCRVGKFIAFARRKSVYFVVKVFLSMKLF